MNESVITDKNVRYYILPISAGLRDKIKDLLRQHFQSNTTPPVGIQLCLQDRKELGYDIKKITLDGNTLDVYDGEDTLLLKFSPNKFISLTLDEYEKLLEGGKSGLNETISRLENRLLDTERELKGVIEGVALRGENMVLVDTKTGAYKVNGSPYESTIYRKYFFVTKDQAVLKLVEANKSIAIRLEELIKQISDYDNRIEKLIAENSDLKNQLATKTKKKWWQ